MIGSHVVDELLKTGVKEVVIYDNFFRGSMDNIKDALRDPRVSIFPHGGDILQKDILEKAMEGVDGVFHLAALWILQNKIDPKTFRDLSSLHAEVVKGNGEPERRLLFPRVISSGI